MAQKTNGKKKAPKCKNLKLGRTTFHIGYDVIALGVTVICLAALITFGAIHKTRANTYTLANPKETREEIRAWDGVIKITADKDQTIVLTQTETGLGEIPEFPAVQKIKVKAGEPTKVEIKKRAWYSVKASGNVEIVPIDVRDAKD